MKNAQAKTNPIDKKEDVKKSHDHRIDEDFKGFPGPPAKEQLINPKTKEDKLTADVEHGENNTQPEPKKSEESEIDEMNSDGSGGAFGSTEPEPGKLETYTQKKRKRGEEY